MKAEIKNEELIITLPISPKVSKSGKSIVIASTCGNKAATCQYKGKVVIIGVNAYTCKDV